MKFRGSPEWTIDVSNEYMREKASRKGVKKVRVFSGANDNDAIVHDDNRKMYDCKRDAVMFYLITAPVTLALAKHGLLKMPDGRSREGRIATWIESEGGPEPPEQRTQGFHSDFATFLAWFFGLEFGFSVLVGCTVGSGVDVLSGTWGSKSDSELDEDDSNVETVCLGKGESIALGPGCRHRGRGYLESNIRHFIAFLGGKSLGASFSFTYNVQRLRSMFHRVKGAVSRFGGRGMGKRQENGQGEP